MEWEPGDVCGHILISGTPFSPSVVYLPVSHIILLIFQFTENFGHHFRSKT